MTEAERLSQINAYLDLIRRHLVGLPEKANPNELGKIAIRLYQLRALTEQNQRYSIERRKDAAEARERVSAMIGTVN